MLFYVKNSTKLPFKYVLSMGNTWLFFFILLYFVVFVFCMMCYHAFWYYVFWTFVFCFFCKLYSYIIVITSSYISQIRLYIVASWPLTLFNIKKNNFCCLKKNYCQNTIFQNSSRNQPLQQTECFVSKQCYFSL